MSVRSGKIQEQIVTLKGGRSLVASFSLTKIESRAWVVFLPESAAHFQSADRSQLIDLVGLRASREFNFLVVNKPGISPRKIDKAEFERSFRRERRVQDILSALQTIIPAHDRIHLVGYSEGAYLAPQVARRDSRVVSVTMIGGGTRGWLKEELNNAKPNERSRFKRKIQEIYRHPSSDRMWNGFSYATWYSYRGDSTLRALRQLDIPTLAVLGARDRMIDVKSAVRDLHSLSERKNLSVHVFDNCGHQFTRHWLPVRRLIGKFLTERSTERAIEIG